MEKGIMVATQNFLSFSGIGIPIGLISGIASRAHPSTSKTSAGACVQSHFWVSVGMHHLSSTVKRDIGAGESHPSHRAMEVSHRL